MGRTLAALALAVVGCSDSSTGDGGVGDLGIDAGFSDGGSSDRGLSDAGFDGAVSDMGALACSYSAQCGLTQACVNGSCAACTANGQCAVGETCVAGGCMPDCSIALQAIVAGAAAGAIVTVPVCTYRERVTVDKALMLAARPGAEIRGSDVWTTFAPSGASWVSAQTVPTFSAHGLCAPNTDRCLWPEQVFLDGQALMQVAAGIDPAAGEFSLDGSRHVVLASNPAGHIVEVTVRDRWISITASDVAIDGFRMRHAAADSQNGGIEADGVSRISLVSNVLSDAHGANVGLHGGSGHRILGNELYRGGQLGLGFSDATDSLVQGNRIHDNNTEAFDSGWEAGGLKSGFPQINLTLDGNDVYDNDGPGLWCDTNCSNTVFSNNRVHGNRGPGIFFEVSTGASIYGNRVWENGWGFTSWGWGAGILASSAGSVDIHDNLVAWNADGIVVISQDRVDKHAVTDNYVHDNTIAAAPQLSDTSDKVMLGWLQDWAGTMYDMVSANRGAGNFYWDSEPEPSCRFGWIGCIDNLAAFNATSGEENGTYLTTAERDQALTAAAMPTTPAPH